MKKKLNHAFNYITAILIFICAMTVSLSIFLVKVQNSIDTNSQNIMTNTVSHQSDHVLSILQIHYGFLNSIADKMGKSSSLLSDGNMKLLVSMAENTDFERTALIEADGTAHYDNGAEKNVAQRRYFQEAMQGKETLSDPLESSIDQEMRVILGVPVYQNGNVIAVLGGSYNVTALSRMLFNDVFDDSGYSLIINQNGEIIAYDGDPAYHEITYGDNFFKFYEHKKLLSDDTLKKIRLDFKNEKDGTVRLQTASTSDAAQYLSYTRLGMNGWMICYVIPVADAQNSYDFIKSDESILLGIFLILVLLLVLYIIRTNRKQNEELIRTAELDGLTGAYNKRATEAYINKILTQMPDEKGTFVILDVDKFKDVNDRYGHAAGDMVLHELAKTFFRHFRKDDIIGRIGGDEFVIYMRNTESKEIASARVKNLIENVRSLPFEEMNGNHVTISVGIAFVPEAGNCYMDLYKNADTALYETKQNGRDGYHVYIGT
nr:sensor domain-containing diguanylate cyclase [uncultured Blautia sp.]